MEQNQEFLTGKEHDDYMDEISSVMTDLTGKVLFIADKHNVDRDNAMQHFSQLLSAMVQISTFEHFGEGGVK
jgi:hypothetical protein